MRPRAPQYRVDSPPVYVPPDDTAWRWDVVEAEERDQPEGWRHPVRQYHAGTTRYRIAEVERYLDPAKSPERWHLRRPPPDVWQAALASVAWLAGRDDQEATEAEARVFVSLARHGVARVEMEGPPQQARDGEITDAGLQAIQQDAPFFLIALGRAVFNAFYPLSDAEKKV